MKECYWSKGSFLNLGSINLGVSYMRLPNIEVIRYTGFKTLFICCNHSLGVMGVTPAPSDK